MAPGEFVGSSLRLCCHFVSCHRTLLHCHHCSIVGGNRRGAATYRRCATGGNARLAVPFESLLSSPPPRAHALCPESTRLSFCLALSDCLMFFAASGDICSFLSALASSVANGVRLRASLEAGVFLLPPPLFDHCTAIFTARPPECGRADGWPS